MAGPLDIISGGVGLLGDLFGSGGSQSFNSTSDVTSNAEAQDLSPELLSMLESLFKSQVGGGSFASGQDAIGGRLEQLSDRSKEAPFDVDSFVKNIMAGASASAGLDLESGLNKVAGGTRTNAEGNSANAILSNRLRTQTANSLAGTAAKARATGEGIKQSEQDSLTKNISGLSEGLQSAILSLIQQTRGASRSGTSTSHEETSGSASSQSGGLLSGIF